MPGHFRSTMKRPDFRVALPYVGLVAFNVKAKSICGPEEAPYLVLDIPEVRRQATFGRLFRVTTYFACLGPEGSPATIWLPEEELMLQVGRRLASTIRVGLATGQPVSMARPFQEALRDLLRLG